MPALAPLRPACQEPSRDSRCPFLLKVAVASPKYQTLPALSAAYQSVVRSASVPPARRRTSVTTRAGTPWIVLVRPVTCTRSRRRSPSSVPRRIVVVPGRNGNHGLARGCAKSVGLNEGEAAGAAAVRLAAAGPTPTAAATVRRSALMVLIDGS